MATDVANATTGNWLRSRRWVLVAPTLLFLWIIAQIDKTNVSLFIADAKFLKELNLVGGSLRRNRHVKLRDWAVAVRNTDQYARGPLLGRLRVPGSAEYLRRDRLLHSLPLICQSEPQSAQDSGSPHCRIV